jgi:hypothetical protein
MYSLSVLGREMFRDAMPIGYRRYQFMSEDGMEWRSQKCERGTPVGVRYEVSPGFESRAVV